MNLPLVFRTVIHLKPIQVFNRIYRRFLPGWHAGPSGGLKPLPQFAFLNETAAPKHWNDPSLPKLWLYNLHYFDFLATMDGETGQSLVSRWIAENPRGYGNGWEPYPISLRVVNWIRSMALRQLPASPCVLESVHSQVRHLLPRLEYHLLANHLLANAKALVFAGYAFGDEKWFRRGMDIYRRELPEQVLADGVHFERSAMYHSIILTDLMDIHELFAKNGWAFLSASSLRSVAPEAAFFDAFAAHMLGGLRYLTAPDGTIVKFNDAADGIAPSPDAIFARAAADGLLPVPISSADAMRGSGIIRLDACGFTLFVKAGEIGPSYQPGHAHADTMSFELWKGNRKLVTDTGTDRYAVDAERRRQRGTAAHNCVMIDGADSSEVWAGHRVARRAEMLGLELGVDFVKARYRDFHGYAITRTLRLSPTGLAGTDEIVDLRYPADTIKRQLSEAWHLSPGVAAEASCSAGVPKASPCDICLEFGRTGKGTRLCSEQRISLPRTIRWTLRF